MNPLPNLHAIKIFPRFQTFVLPLCFFWNEASWIHFGLVSLWILKFFTILTFFFRVSTFLNETLQNLMDLHRFELVDAFKTRRRWSLSVTWVLIGGLGQNLQNLLNPDSVLLILWLDPENELVISFLLLHRFRTFELLSLVFSVPHSAIALEFAAFCGGFALEL